MSSIFTVLIALGLMQPVQPADDERHEINSRYVDDVAVAKELLADAFLYRTHPLALALGQRELDALLLQSGIEFMPSRPDGAYQKP